LTSIVALSIGLFVEGEAAILVACAAATGALVLLAVGVLRSSGPPSAP
jgi:hypothetical protein